MLPDKLDLLKEVGLNTLTVTINAVDPDIGSKIYSFVRYNNQTLRGKEAFEVLSKKQLEGLRAAVDASIVVKVNSVFIPGINDDHLIDVAKKVRQQGAYIMNIMPLIPQAKFANIPAPTVHDIQQIRNVCEDTMFQFHHCRQCRADAVGVPGEEGCGSRLTETERLEKK
jgi:nitrogen fixation protein NifB